MKTIIVLILLSFGSVNSHAENRDQKAYRVLLKNDSVQKIVIDEKEGVIDYVIDRKQLFSFPNKKNMDSQLLRELNEEFEKNLLGTLIGKCSKSFSQPTKEMNDLDRPKVASFQGTSVAGIFKGTVSGRGRIRCQKVKRREMIKLMTLFLKNYFDGGEEVLEPTNEIIYTVGSENRSTNGSRPTSTQEAKATNIATVNDVLISTAQ